MVVKVKHESDVHMIINAQLPTTALGTPLTMILTKGTKSGVYGDVDSLAEDYDETTNVYKQAAAIWEIPSYTSPIEIMACTDDVRHTPGDVVIAKDGSVVAADDVEPGIITGIKSHLYDGVIYVLLDDAFTSDEVQKLSDFLYDQQRLMLVVQVRTLEDLQTLQKHVAAYQTTKSVLTNTTGFLVEEGNYSVDNAAGYAASNVPTDWQHIGNLPDFGPMPGLTIDDYEIVRDLRGITVVNKAGDNMLLQGKALANNYIDQFVHVNLVGDAIENGIQKWSNNHNFPNYNDDSIDSIKQMIIAVCDSYVAMGVLDKQADGTSAIVTVPKRANVSQSDVNNRKLKNVSVQVKIADDIDEIELTLNVTL
ncbi:hypothetical protein [Levilactobacillus sp. 244-2]|uniref:hypothetical protein n=1 Tax=Levilactobacillus sp. 244-2 TaxID=2799569 RepID=UPI0019501CE8|nr:hypothetical protein [Levilactobacillus sp. 244-2]